MRFVIDANIVLSAVITGKDADVLFSKKVELFAPALLFDEIRRHRSEIVAKSWLSPKECAVLIFLLERKIRIVSSEEFRIFFPPAEELLKEHKKDIPYVALALSLSCPFWTLEKRFRGLAGVDAVTTAEVRSLVKI